MVLEAAEVLDMLYDPTREAKKVELDATKGLVESSAINFYAPDVSTEEAQAFFANYAVDRNKPVEKGLNSRLVKDADGKVVEEVYKVGGLYGDALEQVCFWLEEAQKYAENDKQGAALRHLVDYYRTGDLGKVEPCTTSTGCVILKATLTTSMDLWKSTTTPSGSPVAMRRWSRSRTLKPQSAWRS